MLNPKSYIFWLLSLCFVASLTTRADRPPASPVGVIASLRKDGGQPVLRIQFSVPPDHVIFPERLRFETGDGMSLIPLAMPAPLVVRDKITGRERTLYDRSFDAEFKPPILTNLIVKLQACSNSSCYFPEKRVFTVTGDGILAAAAPVAPPVSAMPDAAALRADWKTEFGKFNVVGRATGYIAADDFVSFLNKAQLGQIVIDDDPLARYEKLGLAATLIFVLVGGTALNLTPCVLPLIPINLAIIGAGASSRSRRRGFWHGTIYGAGMALVYGVLGMVVVLTGSTFGTLNSSVWFNAAVAVVFVALALAMFDLINLPFSRFQSSLGETEFFTKKRSRQSVAAFIFGGMAALLAGACVAPVVVSVLLLSTHLYGEGALVGLLLPFVLGLGMALPWPFAGASLTFLPKPGRWMKWVKYSFGVLILLFSFYYGHLAYNLFRTQRITTRLASAPAAGAVPSTGANHSLAQALEQARVQGRPVLIDFQASWCKNCVAMEETVFNRTNVQEHLAEFIVVKYQAERPNESPVREVLDRFSVIGLPTYVVLAPTPAE